MSVEVVCCSFMTTVLCIYWFGCIYLAGDDVVLVFIAKQSGELIASLADNASLKLTMHISLGRQRHLPYSHINKTSVLFVAISFIVLMVISLAWLIFYYVQRFRYTHTKDRLVVWVCRV